MLPLKAGPHLPAVADASLINLQFDLATKAKADKYRSVKERYPDDTLSPVSSKVVATRIQGIDATPDSLKRWILHSRKLGWALDPHHKTLLLYLSFFMNFVSSHDPLFHHTPPFYELLFLSLPALPVSIREVFK